MDLAERRRWASGVGWAAGLREAAGGSGRRAWEPHQESARQGLCMEDSEETQLGGMVFGGLEGFCSDEPRFSRREDP